MKSVGEIVHKDPVWVNPNHVVGSAVLLMRGHNVCGLPVMEGNSLVGILRYENLVGVDVHQRVGDVMWYQVVSLSAALPLREAADIMVREGLTCAPVMGKQGELLGLLTSLELLSELRRSTDPLTELPWSDSLREWGITALRAGREITILFIDINEFGQFNKQFGHVVGDTVLRTVADGMKRLMQPERDILCRYGGDEFCIASLRGAEEAEVLAETLKRVVQAIALPEMHKQMIQVSIGVRGGKRTQEREHIHYAATLNSLINLASRDCIAQKAASSPHHTHVADGVQQNTPAVEKKEDPGSAAPSSEDISDREPRDMNSGPETNEKGSGHVSEHAPVHPETKDERLKLHRLEISWDQAITHVAVEIAYRKPVGSVEESRVYGNGFTTPSQGAPATHWHIVSSQVSRKIEQNALSALIADATLSAVQRVLPENITIRLEDVVSVRTAGGKEMVTILIHVSNLTGDRSLTGTALVGEDAARAVANAVLLACSSLVVEAPSLASIPTSEH